MFQYNAEDGPCPVTIRMYFCPLYRAGFAPPEQKARLPLGAVAAHALKLRNSMVAVPARLSAAEAAMASTAPGGTAAASLPYVTATVGAGGYASGPNGVLRAGLQPPAGGRRYTTATAADAGMFAESAVGTLPYEYSDEIIEDQTVEGSARFVAFKDGRVKVGGVWFCNRKLVQLAPSCNQRLQRNSGFCCPTAQPLWHLLCWALPATAVLCLPCSTVGLHDPRARFHRLMTICTSYVSGLLLRPHGSSHGAHPPLRHPAAARRLQGTASWQYETQC